MNNNDNDDDNNNDNDNIDYDDDDNIGTCILYFYHQPTVSETIFSS